MVLRWVVLVWMAVERWWLVKQLLELQRKGSVQWRGCLFVDKCGNCPAAGWSAGLHEKLEG